MLILFWEKWVERCWFHSFSFFYPSYGLDQNPIFLLFLHLGNGEGDNFFVVSVHVRHVCACIISVGI